MSRGETRTKRVAIVQPNYIPWKGYFDLINAVDEFILLDTVQFTTRDWRNRNRIKTPNGVHWLTIPVRVKGNQKQMICDTHIADSNWADRHWKTIAHALGKAPHFKEGAELLAPLYGNSRTPWLSEIDRHFIETICQYLGIKTVISRAIDYSSTSGKTQRLVDLSRQSAATDYVSGPMARAYLDCNAFQQAGITVSYFEYSGYPTYPQLFPPFEHNVSIVDPILHLGQHASRYVVREDNWDGKLNYAERGKSKV